MVSFKKGIQLVPPDANLDWLTEAIRVYNAMVCEFGLVSGGASPTE
jgi:hypothetical protein